MSHATDGATTGGHATADWHDLHTKGFVVVRNFLSLEELHALQSAYNNAAQSETAYFTRPRIAGAGDVGWLASKLAGLLADVRRAGLSTDIILDEGYFFPTERTQLNWHTDHKSYYVFQDHSHVINFWLPIVKPLAHKSGLSLVPMDKLAAEAAPVHRALLGRGAASVGGNVIRYEEDGRTKATECRAALLTRLAESPPVVPGDLIAARTDVLHKTQDAETVRVAISMRGAWSGQVLRKEVMLSGSLEKCRRMLLESLAFRELLACFWMNRSSTVTVAQWLECKSRAQKRRSIAALYVLSTGLLFPIVMLPHYVKALMAGSPSYRRATSTFWADARIILTSRARRR